MILYVLVQGINEADRKALKGILKFDIFFLGSNSPRDW